MSTTFIVQKPGKDGFVALHELANESSTTRVVLFASELDEDELLEAL